MGIMDVLERLSGPEYDQPAPAEETPLEEIPQEPPAEEAAPAAAGQEAPPAEEAPARLPAVQEAFVHPEPLPQFPAKKPRRLRPEAVMGMIAGFAAALLIAVVALCMPYFTPAEEEDPEALQEYHQQNYEPFRVTENQQEAVPETTAETVPENPTIPPDVNPYGPYDFQYDRHNYLRLQNVKSYAGVDVSAYQGDIDWERVKNSGIEFAIIRLGYRGYESGKLVEDEKAVKNLDGALAAGLKVGAYFFSQALTIQEVDQEMEFMLDILGDREMEMPVVLDWEIPAATARTKNMDARTLTDIQLHFCANMEKKGYQPMVYFNWHQSENLYYLSELEAYPFWLALYQDRMTYPWKVEMWQYSASGRVPGIYGDVDLNVYMPG